MKSCQKPVQTSGKARAPIEWMEIYTRTGLRGMVVEKVHRLLHNCFHMWHLLSNCSTEYDRTARMTSVHTSYRLLVADVTEDIGYPTSGDENMGSWNGRVKRFKMMLVEMF